MTKDELSGFTIVIVVALGIMTIVLLFLFGKRQIMRFTLKSKREPHYSIGFDAHKSLKKEIERRFAIVKDIKYEPKLINDNFKTDYLFHSNQDSEKPLVQQFYRMKAVDELSLLENAIIEASNDINQRRPPGQDLRYYLFKMSKNDNPLAGCDTKLIAQFVDLYINARHEPSPSFEKNQYHKYKAILNELCDFINHKKSKNISRSDNLLSFVKDTEVGVNGQTTVKVISSSKSSTALDNENETSL